MDILKFIQYNCYQVRSQCSVYTAKIKTLFSLDLFTLTSNYLRMAYKVDGNPLLDSCDWSMYSNILKGWYLTFCIEVHLISINTT